jgi:hypothetical protein
VGRGKEGQGVVRHFLSQDIEAGIGRVIIRDEDLEWLIVEMRREELRE